MYKRFAIQPNFGGVSTLNAYVKAASGRPKLQQAAANSEEIINYQEHGKMSLK